MNEKTSLSRRTFLTRLGVGAAGLAFTALSDIGVGTASAAQAYTCAMHSEVRSNDPKGHCPICGMNLIPVTDKEGK